MKRLCLAAFLILLTPPLARAQGPGEKFVMGGFELSGYLNTGAGFQHFSNDPITERVNDGSFAGPIGEWLPEAIGGTVPAPGSDHLQFYIPNFELDITKHFGQRARLRADISFGRPASGSMVNGINIIHAYVALRPIPRSTLEFIVGRFGLQCGFEPYEVYFNDTISWSVIWRGLIAPGSVTGAQVSWMPSDHVQLYLAMGNGAVNDSTAKGNTLPVFASSVKVMWGNEAQQSVFVLTPFLGPETVGNRPLTFGTDATLTWWVTKRWQLGLEAVAQRENATAGGTNTSWYGGLVNLHFEPTPDWYTVLKYCTSWQSSSGAGTLNITGAKQWIHEMSAGFGYYLADNVVWKVEARGDIVDPAIGPGQWVTGVATAIDVAF